MDNEDKKLILEFCEVDKEWYQATAWVNQCQYVDEITLAMAELANLDLNFYFKFAYPQIPKFERYTFLSLWIIEVSNGEDPAEAFGQALLRLVKK